MGNYNKIIEAIKSSDYDFLSTNPHLGDNIILLGLGGSYAYGTNTENSDIDIRGIYAPTKEDILCNGFGNTSEQVTNEATDTTIYSLSKIISLLCNCNPNTIEMLGLDPDQYLYLSPAGQMLRDNAYLFLSKRCINAFGGYANSQLYRLNQKSAHTLSQEGLEKHILQTIEFMHKSFNERYSNIPDDSLKLYIDKSDQEEYDSEIFMDINLHHYPLRDYCGLWNEMKTTVSSYNTLGKRNKHALSHDKIAKHMMHLVRLYLMCFDILEKGEINTHRVKEHDFLMEIRNGKYITDDDHVVPEFFDLVDEYEDKLQEFSNTTTLPDHPDYDKIKALIMQINERTLSENKFTKFSKSSYSFIEWRK